MPLVVQALPRRPPTTLSIGVLGPMILRRGAETVEPPELRRVRVRELLSVLVAERSVPRERAIELIWPDQEPSKGRANLRVTLAHLQSALEPERPRDLPPYFVRATHGAPLAGVLARTLSSTCGTSSACSPRPTTPRPPAMPRPGRRACLLPLDAGGAGPCRTSTGSPSCRRSSSTSSGDWSAATLTLGEIELVGDAAERASSRAERVLAADPYDERAHRLAIAARIQAERPHRPPTAAIDRMREALGELGVGPDERTQVLLRQAHHAQRALV